MDSRKIRIVLLVGVVLAMVFGFAPAHATGGVVCEIAGTVELASYENLILVNGGSGSVSGNVVCEGSVAGAFPLSGSFSFCNHNSATHTGCTATPHTNTSPLEPAYNTISSSTQSAGAPVVTDIVADMSFGNGVCSWHLEGHSLGIIADLSLEHFTCGATTYATYARAQATAAPVILPGDVAPGVTCAAGPLPVKPCFKQLAIIGSIQALQS